MNELWSRLQHKAEQYLITPTPVSTPDPYALPMATPVAAGYDLGKNRAAARGCGDRGQAYPTPVAAMARASYTSGLAFKDVSCTGCASRSVPQGRPVNGILHARLRTVAPLGASQR